MAFYVNTTLVVPKGIPAISTTTSGGYLANDGTNWYWDYPGAASAAVGTGWRYRTILTHGYVAGGYKGMNPWRSLNKTWHQTDTTIYCGEQLDRAAAYLDGTYSDYNAYVHGTSDTFQASSIHTSSYNLFNGITRMQNNDNFSFFGSASAPYGYQGNDPKNEGITYGDATPPGHGGWELSATRTNHGCASSTPGNGGTDGAGYIIGGGTDVTNKLHFPTEIMYATTSTPSVAAAAMAATGGQSQAYCSGSSVAWTMPFSNDTFSTWANGATCDGTCKHLMSKYGWFYGGVGANQDTRIWKFSDATATYMAAYTKLQGAEGEENQQMGQDWGYCLGGYNAQQNNWTVKTTYSTDVMTTMGFATQPKGHYGGSSGACSSAAMSVCSVQRA